MTPPITVRIVTRNRCQMLADCLESLRRQTVPAEQFEILVIDDGSTDDTMHVVERFAATRSNVRYVKISHSGSQQAANLSVRLAQADIIASADDDTLCAPNWLEELVRPLDSQHVACVGGRVEPKWEAEPPGWIDDYRTLLALLNRGPNVFTLRWPHCVNGCNMAVRRDWFERVGGVNPDLVGLECFGDGETGMLLKMWKAGAQVLYSHDAVVYHRIPATRMTREYMRWRFGSQACADAYAAFRRRPWQLLLLARVILLTIAAAAFGVMALCLRKSWRWSYRADFYYAYCKARRAYEWKLFRISSWREMALIDDWLSRDFAAWVRNK